MKPDRAVDELERFLAARGTPLLRTAVLLAGSREGGEDLLQTALERLLGRWRTINGSPEGYLRRTLYNLAADNWRRQRTRQRGMRLLRSAARTVPADDVDRVDLRDALVRLLLELPPRQRAAIVARYWEHMSEAETAEALGCSPGTVKSATSCGVRKLRELSESRHGAEQRHAKGRTS
jgi:RNA polymerase sigma-70 factor (sigma-E family)